MDAFLLQTDTYLQSSLIASLAPPSPAACWPA